MAAAGPVRVRTARPQERMMTEIPEHMLPLTEPGGRFDFWLPAEPVEVPGKGTFPQRFGPGAFNSSIGKIVPVKHEGRVIGHERVVAAEVADDGSGVMFTVEVVDRNAP